VRRRFTPEFVNRIDKMVVFHALGEAELRHIVDLELAAVEGRIHGATGARGIELAVAETAKDYLLHEGIDARYGARHLKRAIERLLVHPVSNLIATGQLEGNDRLLVEFDSKLARLVFMREYRAAEPQIGERAAAA
jgi:ATP-dependent Clp protease ATP-binding subunit ClpB